MSASIFHRSAHILCVVSASALFCFSAAQSADEAKPATSSDSSNPAASGRQIFMAVGCYACHGTVGQGATGVAPKLAPDPLPLPALVAIVRNPPGAMPPYSSKVLSEQALADIHAYLSSIRATAPATPVPEPRTASDPARASAR